MWDPVLQKYNISFRHSDLAQYDEDEWIPFACRKCTGCQIDRSIEWSVRGMHEQEFHDKSMFLTLTYRDEFLDENASLHREDIQKFNKRLRKFFGDKKLRVMYAGEYGENNTRRPHFHVIVFGVCFDDLKVHKYTQSKWSKIHGQDCYYTYTSETLSRLWPYGIHEIGSVTAKSIKYVARYITKKVYGDAAEEHYKGRTPEFFGASTSPGIGFQWFSEFYKDILKGYIHDSEGKVRQVPLYYQDKLKELYPDLYEKFALAKENKQLQKYLKEHEEYNRDCEIEGSNYYNFLDWRAKRNRVKAKLKSKQLSKLVRTYEEN